MKLSISNIAWPAEKNIAVYEILNRYGFCGLEIAPAKIFPQNPYEQLGRAQTWSENLKSQFGLIVSSMQSIWYGRRENMFASEKERSFLLKYTKEAIDFAEIIGCRNLVFGCPRNRKIPEGKDEHCAIAFFGELGAYALEHHTVLALEANPAIYYTNFINTTLQAAAFVREINSKGFRINLDTGTMIENKESVYMLENCIDLINHVHISEPGLGVLKQRAMHEDLAGLLRENHYQGCVSIEMNGQCQFMQIEETCVYIKNLFG